MYPETVMTSFDRTFMRRNEQYRLYDSSDYAFMMQL